MTSPAALDLDVETLIPHRLPMRLVEEIVAVDEDSIVTASVVRETWPTATDGTVRSLVLVELIAQSAAVLQGWKERHEKSTAVGGLLVGIHHAIRTRPTVPFGTRLLCSVRISHGATNYLAFEGEVKDTAAVVWLTGAVQAFRLDGDAPLGEPA
jgi:predicted hotdog family 3-hydroxylacyl-ACP dehydratase